VPEAVEIGGLSLVLEMVYVGKGEKYGYPRNHSLIDPQLGVAQGGDPDGKTLSYWGSYQDLHQTARRTYLQWLDGGRSDPATPIGYVFIFFYGLEWRLLHEGEREDAPAIAAEVRRLLEIYGQNHSFRQYAGRLLDVAELLAAPKAEPIEPSLAVFEGRWEMPLRVRVYLGDLLENGKPFGPDDALLWLLCTPETYLRTPASRCFAELRDLWAIRFAEAYPKGLAVRAPKARIRHAYRAASGGFHQELTIDALPDIGSVSAPLTRLRALLNACTDELDPLSRLLGRRPDARGTMAAAALAPAELLAGSLGEGHRRCSKALGELLGDAPAAPVSVREVHRLLELECPEGDGRVGAAPLRQMAASLDSLGYGFEPDRRYGCTLPVGCNSNIVIFAAAGGGRVDADRPAYRAARTMIEIGALAALSDGVAVPAELECIRRDLASLSDLDQVERSRLTAQAEALMADPPKRKETIARLAALPVAQRRRVTQAAISAVLADGHVLPAEVRFLEGLHTALGLPQDEVYSALHRSTVLTDEPLPVGEEGAGKPAFASPGGGGLTIDAARLARIRGETTAVSQLLATIFVEEEAPAPIAAPAATQVPVRFEGLDGAHGELLWTLVQGPLAWEAFEEQARSAKLLPAGAVETINEWGFEVLGEPVLEEDDPISVAEHLIGQLSGLGGRA
jgi:hypothetical protein